MAGCPVSRTRLTVEPAAKESAWWAWVRRQQQYVVLLAAVLIFLGVWRAVVWLGNYPPFILPTPGRVYQRFVIALSDGTLCRHTGVTMVEILSGLVLGLSTALILGYWMAKSHTLERFVAPYIVASQAVPIVALAPLLVIWFGPGRLSKILVCALTLFFPMLMNTVVGLRSVNADLVNMMRSLQATRWQMFTLLEVPSALPTLLGGLKVSMTLSVIGAVVGEFVAADRGLGFLINVARGNFDTALMFVAILTLVVIALALYLSIVVLEKGLFAWRR